jgi:predicted molibdopterin-dependent oxidoreductase YjgC
MSTHSAPDVKTPVPRGPLPILPQMRPTRMVEITIDGKPVSVAEDSTLLEAARSIGIDTPTLCFLESLTPVNVCRICVVEV